MLVKGTIIHEIINLPRYWSKLLSVDSSGFKTVKHKFGENRKQYLIEFIPERETRQAIIIYYHGGGWRHGKPEFFRAKAKRFTDLGYRVFMPSYRKIPFNNVLDIRKDLQLAVKFVSAFLSKQGEGKRNLILGGMSAGGHLAALLAADHRNLLNHAFSTDQLKGVFLLAPPANLDKMANSPYIRALAGKQGSKIYNKANPHCFIDQYPDISTLIFHGTRDGFVPFSAGQSFAEALKRRFPDKIDFRIIQDGTHLDAVSWVHENNVVRKRLFEWLDTI